MANEMVARADAGFENIWGLQDCAETLNEFASEEIKAEIPAVGFRGRDLRHGPHRAGRRFGPAEP